MTLSKEYFNAIRFETVRHKYYNKSDVDSVLREIQNRADALMKDNEQLKRKLSFLAEKVEELQGKQADYDEQIGALSNKKEEISDTLLSAKAISQTMIAEANETAEKTVSEAMSKAEEILTQADNEKKRIEKETEEQKEEAVKRFQELYSKMRDQHMACIETLNQDWQDFLKDLYPEEPEAEKNPDNLPEDLSEKVSEIAKQLQTLEDE